MHNVGPNVNQDEVASFTIRDTVEAIPCPEGAVVTDERGDQLASYADKCYVVIDGDQRFIVSAYVFDGLYTETSEPKANVTTADDIAAAHAQATPVTTAAQAATPTGPAVTTTAFTADAAAVLSELTPEQRAELRDALDSIDPAPAPTDPTPPTSSSTGSTDATGGSSTAGADVTAAAGNAGTAELSTADPSVAALSDTSASPSGDPTTGGQ